MSIADSTFSELKRRAREAAQHAYAPYSGFAVGAAVLGASGRIHAGANVENASYGLSMCAERSAVFRALAEGERRIEAVCLYTPTADVSTPCGACRQVIQEFGAGVLIVCCTDDAKSERRYTLPELLPDPFRLRK